MVWQLTSDKRKTSNLEIRPKLDQKVVSRRLSFLTITMISLTLGFGQRLFSFSTDSVKVIKLLLLFHSQSEWWICREGGNSSPLLFRMEGLGMWKNSLLHRIFGHENKQRSNLYDFDKGHQSHPPQKWEATGLDCGAIKASALPTPLFHEISRGNVKKWGG